MEENNYLNEAPLSTQLKNFQKGKIYDSILDATKGMDDVNKSFKDKIKKMISEDDEISKEKKEQFENMVNFHISGLKWSQQMIYGKVKITVEEEYDQIIKRIEETINKLKRLDSFHYLKTTEISVIKSLWEALKLSDDKVKEIKGLIKDALTDNFKVKFVNHEGEFANTGYFTYETYENLEKSETVLQTLVSSENEEVCIRKGIRKKCNKNEN